MLTGTDVVQTTMLGWKKWFGCWGEPAN